MTEVLPEIVPVDPRSLPVRIDDIPYWHQRDARWCFEPYSITDNPEQTIGRTGCVPTTQAMLLAHFEKDLDITPPRLAEWNIRNGFRTETQGTDSSLSMPEFAKDFDRGLESLDLQPETFRRALGGGALIYVVVRHPDRENTLGTPGSHAIIIRQIWKSFVAAHTSSSEGKSLRTDWDLEQVVSMADPAKTYRISRR